MSNETGFLYLNLANEWPKFELSGQPLEKTADGSLRLVRTNDSFAPRAVFMGGPFELPAQDVLWHRLRLYGDPLPEGTHVQLFTKTTKLREPKPDFPPGADSDWQAAPRDSFDVLILNQPAPYLWVGGVVRSDGGASPVIRQMRVDYGRDTYLSLLPAIYGQDEAQRDFLERFLSLPESVLGSLEQVIDELPQLFDPWATPNGNYPSWLGWLAGWLDFDLNEVWPEGETRANLAAAYDLYGQRGTVSGLRRYLQLYAGVEAHITEPGLQTALWSLGETSTLGFTTMLAPAQPQGAVLGTSATLDQSHVTQADAFGAALFEDVAHHFCVQVYCADLNRPGALDDVVQVIDREKPAHTTYHLCLIEPRLRVGVQARVGIDAVVAQGPPPAQVGMMLDSGILARPPVEPHLRVGVQARTGIDAVVARRNRSHGDETGINETKEES